MLLFERESCYDRRMSISTLVVRGPTGPLHRAILRVVTEWSNVQGLPDLLSVSGTGPGMNSLTGPGMNSLTVITDTRLCVHIRNELYRRILDETDPIWVGRQGQPDPPSPESFSAGLLMW